MTLFIGDVHGKYRQYRRIIADTKNSIQVGDMGVGFRRWPHGELSENPPHATMSLGGHRFIRGNHDNPSVCKQQSQYIHDGYARDGIMFVGGAVSIDKQWRIEGYSWWPDEELSTVELMNVVDTFSEERPHAMVTHECPDSIASILCNNVGVTKYEIASRTRQAFQSMFEIHQPEIWIFGHWHFSFDAVIDGTRFVCLSELEYREFDVGL